MPLPYPLTPQLLPPFETDSLPPLFHPKPNLSVVELGAKSVEIL